MESTDSLQKIARAYIEAEAKLIDLEADELEKEPDLVLPRLEKRVAALRARRKRTRTAFIALAAAAAVLALLVWRAPVFIRDGGAMLGGPDKEEAMELSFELPEGMEVVSSEVENGRTVYTISDGERSVVLTMEPPGPSSTDFSAMDRVLIDGDEVPVKFMADSKTIAFEHGGVVYTITAGDTATLFELYRIIVKT